MTTARAAIASPLARSTRNDPCSRCSVIRDTVEFKQIDPDGRTETSARMSSERPPASDLNAPLPFPGFGVWDSGFAGLAAGGLARQPDNRLLGLRSSLTNDGKSPRSERRPAGPAWFRAFCGSQRNVAPYRPNLRLETDPGT